MLCLPSQSQMVHLLCLRLASPPSSPPTKIEMKRNRRNNNLSLSSTSSSLSLSSSSSLDGTVEYLSVQLGIDPHRALSLNPSLRTHPVSSLRRSHALLLSTGLSPPQISRLFASHPLLLTHPFLPSLRFLRSLFPSSSSSDPSSLAAALSRCPRLLSSPVPSQLLPALLFLRRLSVPITPSTSLLLASHVESTLLPKLDFLLHSLPGGSLPYPHVKHILRRFPRLLTYSVPNNLLPKALFLHHDMNLHVPSEITRFPQYFAFNLDKRIKRRHRLLLQSGFQMTLQEMLTTSDGDFDQRILDRKLQMLDDIVRHNSNRTTS